MTKRRRRHRFTLYRGNVPCAHADSWRALRCVARTEGRTDTRVVKRLPAAPFPVVSVVWTARDGMVQS